MNLQRSIDFVGEVLRDRHSEGWHVRESAPYLCCGSSNSSIGQAGLRKKASGGVPQTTCDFALFIEAL
jgi:hypothetical protein